MLSTCTNLLGKPQCSSCILTAAEYFWATPWLSNARECWTGRASETITSLWKQFNPATQSTEKTKTYRLMVSIIRVFVAVELKIKWKNKNKNQGFKYVNFKSWKIICDLFQCHFKNAKTEAGSKSGRCFQSQPSEIQSINHSWKRWKTKSCLILWVNLSEHTKYLQQGRAASLSWMMAVL